MRSSKVRALVESCVIVALVTAARPAGADVEQVRPVPSGLNGFFGDCPRPQRTTLLEWSRHPGQGRHRAGTTGPHLRRTSFHDPGSGASIRTLGGLLDVSNWVDAPGFGEGPKGVRADLGSDGALVFQITLNGCKAVGFGIGTGLSNVPRRVDARGARFRVSAYRGESGSTLLFSRTVDLREKVDSVWLTLSSNHRITRIVVREIGARSGGTALADQYFTDVMGCDCLKTRAAMPARAE